MDFKIWKSDFLSLAIILLVPLFIVGGALFNNQALLPTDLLSQYPAWWDFFEIHKASNGLLSDAVFQFYPWHKLAYENAQTTGGFPLWNPYELTGQPMVANAQSALFYPPNILLHWVPPEIVPALCAYFNFVLLGLCTFYFCREINLGRTASIFSATTAMLMGPMIVHLSNPLVNAMAPFPLMLLAGEKILNYRRLIPWIVALSVSLGLSLLGGHPETTIHICFAFGLYFSLRLIGKKPGYKKGFLCLGAVSLGVLLGLLLGSIQWIPFLKFLFNSATLSQGGRFSGGTQIFYSDQWSYYLTLTVTYLIPNFFGSPITANYLWPFPNYNNFNEQTIYFGLIPLAMSFSVLFSRRRKPQGVILLGISCFFLAVALRLPGFEVVNHIFPFNFMNNTRMKIFASLMLTIVAGIGLEDWLHSENSKSSLTRSQVVSLIPPLLALTIYAIIGFVNIFSPALDFLNKPFQDFGRRLVYQVFNLNQPRIMISFAVAVVFIIVCVLNWQRIINRPFFGLSALSITLIELVVLAWNYNPVTTRNLVYPEIPISTFLQQETQPFRMMSTELMMFPPNAGAVYEIAQVEGYDLPVLQSFFDLYQAQGGKQAPHRQVWSIDFPLIDWLNIRYVISPNSIQKDGFTLVLDHPSYKVYRNENASPRAYMVYDYQVIEDKATLLETMVSAPEILKEKVLFNAVPPEIPMEGDKSSSAAPAKVEFAYYGMDRSVLDVDNPRAGFLMMTDIYMEGWKADIDGHSAQILNADYTYRALYLPPGLHQVEFYYQPASFVIGKALSLFGLFILFSGGCYLTFTRFRVRKDVVSLR